MYQGTKEFVELEYPDGAASVSYAPGVVVKGQGLQRLSA